MNVMPDHGQFAATSASMPVTPNAVLQAEMALIAACLVNPASASEILAKVSARDVVDPLTAASLDILRGHLAEGRTPSLSALMTALEANASVEERMAAVDVRRVMVVAMTEALTTPWQDALETVLDWSQRRSLHALGQDLLAQAFVFGLTPADIAGTTVENLDDIVAAMRAGKRRSYDAAGAADIALAHLDSSDPPYPTTGLAGLDRMIGGWPKGELSIIAGRPGMAKSACATSFAIRAARKGYGAGFFSLEMKGEQLGARMLADMAYSSSAEPIHYEAILKRSPLDERLRQRLKQAREMLAGLPLQIEEQRGLTLSEIAARTRKMISAFDRQGRTLSLIVVDHLSLVRPSSRYAGSRVNEVSELTDGLATLAKDLDIAVVALSQLNRAVEGREDKRPTQADLRDSGSIEQDASLIIFPYRPAYYLENRKYDEPEADRVRQEQLAHVRNVIEFGVAKNRNGRVGVVEAFVDIGANAVRDKSFHG